MEKQPDLLNLTEQEKDALIITLFDVIKSLRLQFRQQADDIEKLKVQLDKNSLHFHLNSSNFLCNDMMR
jgi:hypothetical protein